jgi:hypothetical protein
MIRQVEVTVSPLTTVAAPNETAVKLCVGIFSRLYVRSAPGCNGEVYFRVQYRENSFIPDNNDEWIPLSGEILEFNPNFSSWDGTYNVILQLCSPDARFEHIIQFEFEVIETETLEQLFKEFIERGF